MKNILGRLQAYGEFRIVVFGSETILNEPVENWPLCDVLISFHSGGFPLEKSIEYVHLRDPICVNDVPSQGVMLSRREVYEELKANDIACPRHYFYDHDNPGDSTLEEFDDYLLINGERLDKPLVEKPMSGEDHNVYIYYAMKDGGGSRRLFRKIANRSSQPYPDISTIRRDGSYIYEEFIPGGIDVKVYTIFSDYAHAEMRKAPSVDGVVQRDINGKEVRTTTRLFSREREMAKKVCLAFKQNICGFDLVRYDGRSYVIDVNGWSFVKGNLRYYDDCARRIREFSLQRMNRWSPPHYQETNKDSSSPSSSPVTKSVSSTVASKPAATVSSALPRSPASMPPRLPTREDGSPATAAGSATAKVAMQSTSVPAATTAVSPQAGADGGHAPAAAAAAAAPPTASEGRRASATSNGSGDALATSSVPTAAVFAPPQAPKAAAAPAPEGSAPAAARNGAQASSMPRAPQVSSSPRKLSFPKTKPSALSPSFHPTKHATKSSISATKPSPKKRAFVSSSCRAASDGSAARGGDARTSIAAAASSMRKTSGTLLVAMRGNEVSSDADVALLAAALGRVDTNGEKEPELRKLALTVSDFVGTTPLNQAGDDAASADGIKRTTPTSHSSSGSGSALVRSALACASSEWARAHPKSKFMQRTSASASALPSASSRHHQKKRSDHSSQREVSLHEAHCSAESCSESESEASSMPARKSIPPPPVPVSVPARSSTTSATVAGSSPPQTSPPMSAKASKISSGYKLTDRSVPKKRDTTPPTPHSSAPTPTPTPIPIPMAAPAPFPRDARRSVPSAYGRHQRHLSSSPSQESFMSYSSSSDESDVFNNDGFSSSSSSLREFGRSASSPHLHRSLATGGRDPPKKPVAALADVNRRHILLGMAAVFRHADRTAKQKLKFLSSHALLLNYFVHPVSHKEIKIKKKGRKIEVLNTIRKILEGGAIKDFKKFRLIEDVLQTKESGTKIQFKPTQITDGLVAEVQVICKWGGALTTAGKRQCEMYGGVFRKEMLRGTPDERESFLNNMQVYTSDEQRVKVTAKSFVTSFLLGEKIAPESIHQGQTTQILLDNVGGSNAEPLIKDAKAVIAKVFSQTSVDPSLLGDLADTEPAYKENKPHIRHSLKSLRNPLERIHKLLGLVKTLIKNIDERLEQDETATGYRQESLSTIHKRWDILCRDLYDVETGEFNTTKLPDVFDCVRYDALHNADLLRGIESLYYEAKCIADFVVPAEYGIGNDQKRRVGSLVAGPLVTRIIKNFKSCDSRAFANSRVFLYFTSESYLHALRNILLHSGIASNAAVAESVDSMELGYFTHSVIRLFEDPSRDPSDPMHQYVSIMFSSGATSDPFACSDNFHSLPVNVPLPLNGRLSYQDFQAKIQESLDYAQACLRKD